MRNYISDNLAFSLYNSLIVPHFAGSDIVYDGSSASARRQLQIRQNNSLRAVLNVDSRFSTEALHTKTGVKWLDVSRKERCCVETYKTLNGLTPPGINKLFPTIDKIRTLRSSNIPNFLPILNRTK